MSVGPENGADIAVNLSSWRRNCKKKFYNALVGSGKTLSRYADNWDESILQYKFHTGCLENIYPNVIEYNLQLLFHNCIFT